MDEGFEAYVGERLAALPGVEAVALGGSRAAGSHRADSDWDFSVYYRGPNFTPDHVRALGWPGVASEIGEWGGGVFNGGAWLEIDGRHIDVHYRDLDDVERILADIEDGRFHIERLMFHLAGIPSYLIAAELAVNRVLYGSLPRPDYPPMLRRTASEAWWGMVLPTLEYARAGHATRGHVTDTVGAIALAACQTAHAILAARGEWVTNEKTLLDRAGLRDVDRILEGLVPDPGRLAAAVDATTTLLTKAYGHRPP